MSSDAPSPADTRLSKAMTWVLRHGAVELKLPISSDGFIPLTSMMALRQVHGATLDDIQRVVRNCKKQRFALDTSDPDTSKWRIRANQGHTIKAVQDSDLLVPITLDEAQQGLICIHGTYFRHWESIVHHGLCRMARNHIHFAAGESTDVISGMRTSAQLKIYVDVAAAIADGIPFFRSDNNVLLCAGIGDKGVLPPTYFVKVVRTKDGAQIYPN
ncbi:hypothetical protein H257_18268 [Aphanomyces astaci]|uniref:2'-phosphotransferase n=1 Tax=Aphanomyces astaci TaxID=112090 RepID=W4FBN3_APHAT|nr:hypothetical protein H257_18268 [Aphanomyces astaci]ETV64900.1 hypothetical protein H257_18268 [Aphanomyces astaci]|eukprot:XP_009845597.1 hypothetical protein H257_18268 [Aphanomyces astaci]